MLKSQAKQSNVGETHQLSITKTIQVKMEGKTKKKYDFDKTQTIIDKDNISEKRRENKKCKIFMTIHISKFFFIINDAHWNLASMDIALIKKFM